MTNEALKGYIERVERLSEERQAIADDIKEVYAEAKGNGFDVKAMREVVRLRKMNKADREEMDALVGMYSDAVGL